MGTKFLYGLLLTGFELFSPSNVLFVRSQIALSKNPFQNIMLKYDSFKPTVKYAITPSSPKIIITKFYFFYHQV